MRPRQTSSMVARAGAGEQAAGVVAAEEGGGQVEHVAVDQAGGVEVVGHRGAALDQHLQHAPCPELVEDLAEVARASSRPGGPGRRRGPRPSTTRSGLDAVGLTVGGGR